MERFEASIEIRYRNCGFTLERGVGATIEEARNDLIRRIEKNSLIFPPEKEQIKQMLRELRSEEENFAKAWKSAH